MHTPSATYGHALELSSSEQHVGKAVRTGGADSPPLFCLNPIPIGGQITPTILIFVPPVGISRPSYSPGRYLKQEQKKAYFSDPY